MAGWKTEDMLNGIEGVMSLAAASGEDLGTVSDIVTDALTAFGLEAKDSGRFADVLAAASANANTNVGMLGKSFEYAAPVAGAMGYSVEDTAVALGLMANAGIKADKGGTALRTMMTNLAKPTKQMKGAMDDLGISITNQDGSMKTLDEIMQDLRKSFKGMDKDQQAATAATIFGKEAMSGALAVINASEKDYNKLSKAINGSEGAAKKMSDIMEGTLGGTIREIKSGLEGFAISIYEAMLPALEKGAEKIKGMVNWLNNLSPSMKIAGVIIAGLVAAIGPLLIAGGMLISLIGSTMTTLAPLMTAIEKTGGLLNILKIGFTALTGPIGITVGIITLLTTGFITLYKNSETFRNGVHALIEKIKELAGEALSMLKVAIDAVVSFFRTQLATIQGFWKENSTVIIQALTNVYKFIKNIFENGILPVIKFVMLFILDLIKSVWKNIQGVIQGTLNVIMGAIKIFSGLFTGNWSKMWEGVKQVLKGAVEFAWNWLNLMFIGRILRGIGGFSINLVKSLKGGWDKAIGGIKSFVGTAKSWFDDLLKNGKQKFDDLVTAAKAMPGKMKDGIVKGAGAVKEGMLTVARKMVDGLASGVNGVISGIDWVLDKLKAPKLDYEFKPSSAFSWYAKGTDGHPGGHAVLGDGTGNNAGSELTLLPNGKAFMSADKPTLYPNLPKGTQVISAKNTRKLFDSIPMYNSGKGRLNSAISKGKGIFNWGKEKVTSAVSKVKEWTGNVFDYIKKPGELLNIAINKLGVKIPSVGIMGDIAKGGFKFVKDKAFGYLKNKLTGFFDGGSVAAPTGKGVSRWKNVILQAAAAMGEKITGAELNGILAQIQRESGGNEKIIQSSAVWDVNTAAGNPARGLLQYIPQTFAAYKVPGHGNIYSGYDQLLAFFNNKTWRRDLPYGRRGWGPRGGRKFATGGLVNEGLYHLGEEGWPEWIIPTAPNRRTEAMKLLALAGKEIQGNKRPNQLPSVGGGNGGSNDNGYMKQLLEATLQQNKILMQLLQKDNNVYLDSDMITNKVNERNAIKASLNYF